MKNFKRIHWLIILICLSTVINGSAFWMHRTGLLGQDRLSAIISERESIKDELKTHSQLPDQLGQADIAHFTARLTVNKKELLNFLYSTPGALITTKLFKYFAVALLLLLALAGRPAMIATFQSIDTAGRLFVVYLCGHFLITLLKGQFSAALVSVYSYSFILISLTATRLASRANLSFLARCCTVMIIILMMFCLYEVYQGVQIFQNQSVIQKRMTGFMNQPNSMGIFSVFIASFIGCCYNHRFTATGAVIFLLIVALLVFFSQSSTATIMYAALVYQFLRLTGVVKINRRLFLTAAVLSLAGLAIVYIDSLAINSITGRLNKYVYYFSSHHSSFDYIFGQGMGIASNSMLQVNRFFPTEQAVLFSVDSTPLLLIIEIGFIGCVLFYCLLIVELIKDRQLRFAYLMIFLASFTTNIIELFPVNILLGLMLAYGANRRRQGEQQSRLV